MKADDDRLVGLIWAMNKQLGTMPLLVDFCKSVMEVECSCKHYEAYGLLCRHIVLRMNSIKELPHNKRWSKNAKSFNTAEPLQPSKKI
ncbi:FAR1 DNA binding domain, zinc finger, SWIM-type, MULE transposase domain containing protein, partial [Tanacetum coccineum]